MKTTYKLLGLHWDGMPEPTREPKVIEMDEASDTISASTLFATKALAEADALIDEKGGVDEVVVLSDCAPASLGGVLQNFYRKRLLQACAYIERKLPGARVVIGKPQGPSGSPGITGSDRYLPIDNLLRFMQVIDDYAAYLSNRGIKFDNDGFPLLDRSCFLDEWPAQIVTHHYRNCSLVMDKDRTVLCFFAPDQQIYPRLAKIFDEIDEYRRYLGVVMVDTTVTRDMDVEWQAATMLLNQLFMAVLAVNDVKVVANMRCGSPATMRYLEAIPRDVMWASGRLGCNRISDEADFDYIAKVLAIAPSKLVLYGPPDRVAAGQLAEMGVDFKRYPDVHAQYDVRKRKRRSVA